MRRESRRERCRHGGKKVRASNNLLLRARTIAVPAAPGSLFLRLALRLALRHALRHAPRPASPLGETRARDAPKKARGFGTELFSELHSEEESRLLAERRASRGCRGAAEQPLEERKAFL
ncbi:hypothetical protein KM043_000549 [Ampulex compressa]|nr:hypothetical protein KM043_000549 [Ampulex compressa]